MGRKCKLFPNCNKLQEKFDVPINVLYTYIRTYNDYAVRNKIDTIKNNVAYSDEDLEEIYKNISSYRLRKMRDENFARAEQKSLIKSFGSAESYALSMVQSSTLTGYEIEDLRQEIASEFVNTVRTFSERTKVSPDDFIKRVGVRALFKVVQKNLTEKIVSDMKAISSPEKDGMSEDTINSLQASIDLGRKFLPLMGAISYDLFNELCILTIPLINSLYDVKIQNDFTVSGGDIKQNQEALEISDKEEPIKDSWQENLDNRPAEGSVSAIVRRILLNTPKVKIVATPKFFYDGKQISEEELSNISEDDIKKVGQEYDTHREVVRGTIMNKALFADPSQEIRRLFGLLENATSEDEMIYILNQQEKYTELADYLESHPREKTTFFADFNKYFQEMFAAKMVENPDGTFSISVPSLNGGGKESLVKSYFGDLSYGSISDNSFYRKEIVIGKDNSINRKNRITANYKKFIAAKQWFERMTDQKDSKDPDSSEIKRLIKNKNYNRATDIIAVILDNMNIKNDITVINEMVQNPILVDKFISAAKGFYDRGETQFLASQNKKAKNIVDLFRNDSKFIDYLNEILKLTRKTDTMTQASVATVEYNGNTVSQRILPSAITNFIKKVHQYNEDDLINWLTKTYLDGDQFMMGDKIYNRWIKDLVEAAPYSGSGSIKDYFSLTRNLGIGDTKFENISDRDHMLSFIFQYLNYRNFKTDFIPAKEINGSIYTYNSQTGKYDILVENPNGGKFAIVDSINTVSFDKDGKPSRDFRKDKAMIPLFITGDTNALRLFTTMHYYESEILDGMYNLYLSDKATQNIIASLDSHGIVVSANGKETLTKGSNSAKFGILQFLNDEKWSEKLKSIEKHGIASDSDFVKLAKEYLDEEFETFCNIQLESLGILDKTTDGKYVYFNDFLSDIKDNDFKTDYLYQRLKEFFFDYKFGLYNQTHIQHVTPLEFSGVEDHQKRNKVGATNGTSISVEARIGEEKLFSSDNFSQKVVYFKDVFGKIDGKTQDAIFEYMVKQYEKTMDHDTAVRLAKQFVLRFDKNSLTDGEAYRSFRSYRAILAGAGLNFWTEAQEKAYNKISDICASIRNENRNATVEEIQTIENELVAMQPIKPVNDGIETYQIGDTKVKIGFQFKYAEIPLIPELYPVGSKLRQMGQWMEDNKIDLMASDKCLKKGSFEEIDVQFKSVNGQYVDKNNNVLPGYDMNNELVDNPTMAQQRRYVDITKDDRRVLYDDNTSFSEIISNQPSYYIHNIPLDNYLIQNNVPDHSDGNVIVGTQMRKIIGSMIKNNRTYNINVSGKNISISGDKLFKIYNGLHTAKYFKSFLGFVNLINDSQRLSKNISYTIATNGRSNVGLLERISLLDDGTPVVPYSEISNQRDLMSAIISMFKKTVIRQQISGGNIVQASSMGVGPRALVDPDLMPIVENGILTGMEAEMPFMFSVETEDGYKIPLKYEDYCNDDGTFKLSEDGEQTLIEKDYPGILDMVMYRIPTEGGYSMYRVHVKRVTPKTSANTIKLPVICTTISDFDFDIDKLMFMKRTFKSIPEKMIKVDEEGNEIDSVIWNQIYSENPVDIKLKLHLARERASNAEKRALAEERGITVDKLRLNHYWPLSDILESKSDVYNRYAERFVSPERIEGSTFNFDSDGSDLLDLSLSAIDNAIVDVSQAILSDESTMEERITPGGFPLMSDDARVLRLIRNKEFIPEIVNIPINTEEEYNNFVEYLRDHKELDYKSEYDYSSPMTSVIFKQLNQVAGQEIGIFANDNVNDAISKRLAAFMIKDPSKAILFGSLLNKNSVIKDADGNIVTGQDDLLGRNFLFYEVNGRVLSKSLHELLGSSVDAVKDNALVDINLNYITGDLGAILVRLGYSTYDIGLLFNQPIVKQLCQQMELTKEQNASKVLRRLIKQYSKEGKPLNKPVSKKDVTSFNLAKNISGKVDPITQVNVARILNQLLLVKQEVSDYVQQTRNTSANTVKVDIGKYLSNKQKQNQRLKNGFKIIYIKSNDNLEYPITNEAITESWSDLSARELSSKIRSFMDKYNDHPFEYENAVYNIIDAAMNMMIKKYTPFRSGNYTMFRDKLTQYMAPWGLSGEHINEIHSFIPALVLKDLNGDFNPDATNNPIGIANKEYYLKHIVDILLDAIDEGYDDNGVFSSAFSSENLGTEEDPYVVLKFKYPTYNLSPFEKFGFTMNWDEMMKSGGKTAELAKALYLHSYYINGLIPGVNPLMSIAPVSVLDSLIADSSNETTYLDTFDEDFNDNLTEDKIASLAIQFMIYHSNDNKIVPVMPWHIKDVSDSGSSIIVTGDKLDDVRMMASDKNHYFVRPIIKVDGALYVLADNNGKSYDINDVINNVISKNTASLVYVRLEVASNDDFRAYSKYYNNNNGYIFGDYNSSVDTVVVDEDDEKEVRSDEDNSDTDSKIAADIAAQEPETPDSRNLTSCSI